MMPLEDVLTDTAYVFYDSDRILCGQYPFYYNLADGLIVGTVDPVEGGDNLRGNDPLFQEYSQSFTNQQYLTNGSDVDERRYIYQGGVSYGPYIPLKQGRYLVTITGENLTSADLFCYAGYGSEPFNLENTQTADSEVSYIVTFDHDVKNIEFVVQNNRSERAIVLDSVCVARMLG